MHLLNKMKDEGIREQRAYYAAKAATWDQTHSDRDEHGFAMGLLICILQNDCACRSVLEIGAGTGHDMGILKSRIPQLSVIGVEPVAEFREVGYRNGIPKDALISGDATNLSSFRDDSMDFCIGFGVLHQIPENARAVREMVRVARRGVFLSDGNNVGHGKLVWRLAKATLKFSGLWPLVNFLKTRGKGYVLGTEGFVEYSALCPGQCSSPAEEIPTGPLFLHDAVERRELMGGSAARGRLCPEGNLTRSSALMGLELG